MQGFTELYNTFDPGNHLQPWYDKNEFESARGWDFGWKVLEPLNIAGEEAEERELAKRLSPGQKALYFFWYLDAEVTNGGFIQFYWNGKRRYLPPIIDGLKLIGDTELLELVNKADAEYTTHREQFILQKEKDDWEPLYENLKNFDEYDSVYYSIHDKTMERIENYIRKNTSEFAKLR